MSPAPPRGRLRNRLMLAFAGFALLVAALYGAYVLLFAYLVEDRFFQGLLQQEAQAQLAHHATQGTWRQPQLPFVSLHVDPVTLPDGLAARLADQPWRREFDGLEGRHYHLQRLDALPDDTPAWLAAEVSQQLAVRPMRGGIAQWLGWSSLVVLALALSIGAWLAHRLTAPLSRLATLVDAASPSRLPIGFSAGFPDNEVGTLARGLEQMIQRIDDFVAREREFTRDASHELRTPLAVIRSACERLGSRDTLDPETRRQLDHVKQSAQQLEQTVATLLALARETSHAEAPEDITLLPLLERAIVDQSHLLTSREVEVRVDVPATLRTRLPKTVLHIVLSNLVGNAFAHTRDGTIRMRMEGTTLQILNPSAAMPVDVFEPYVRGADSTGHGIGLAIVRRLCERHGITVRLDLESDQTIARLDLGSDGSAAPAAQGEPACR